DWPLGQSPDDNRVLSIANGNIFNRDIFPSRRHRSCALTFILGGMSRFLRIAIVAADENGVAHVFHRDVFVADILHQATAIASGLHANSRSGSVKGNVLRAYVAQATGS